MTVRDLFLVLLLAVVGFGIAEHIRRMRTRRVPMTCPIGGHCDSVLTSRYNAIFGVPNEIAGMAYYASVAIGSLLILTKTTTVLGAPVDILLLLAGGAGLLFSIVFTYIQGRILHAWCSWCLASAAVNLAIFALELRTFAIPF